MLELNSLSDAIQVKSLESLPHTLLFIVSERLIEFTLLFFQKSIQIVIFLYPCHLHLFGLHPNIIDFPLLLFLELVICPHLVYLEGALLLNQPPVLFQLILSVLQSHQLMLRLYLTILL
jgi:hypothetical protein